MTPSQMAAQRERYQLTQRALADLLGTTESTVSRLERGATPIDSRWASHLNLLWPMLNRYPELLEHFKKGGTFG